MGWGGWVNYLQRSMIFYAYICIYVYMYIGTHLYIYMCRYGDMYMCIDVSCSRVVPHEVIWSHLFPSQGGRWSHSRISIVLLMHLGGILQKACVPRDSFGFLHDHHINKPKENLISICGYLHLASAKCTLLCQMHTFILNGNCLVELNLTSKRNSGWVGWFIIHPDQGVWS